jgi:DNA-binding MarR family transcriptional regulator
VKLTIEEKLVLLTLEQTEPTDVHQLAALAGLHVRTVKHLLRELKAKGLIDESEFPAEWG